MTQHDTPEEVRAMANSCAMAALDQKQRGLCCGETDCGGTCCAPACLFGETMHCLTNAAAMLLRLHQRAADAEQDRAEAHGYLSRLLTSMHPQCEPLPDLLGLCTQIDNAMTEIRTPHASLATARADALREAAEAARTHAVSEGWSGTSALRFRNCILALIPQEKPHDR